MRNFKKFVVVLFLGAGVFGVCNGMDCKERAIKSMAEQESNMKILTEMILGMQEELKLLRGAVAEVGKGFLDCNNKDVCDLLKLDLDDLKSIIGEDDEEVIPNESVEDKKKRRIEKIKKCVEFLKSLWRAVTILKKRNEDLVEANRLYDEGANKNIEELIAAVGRDEFLRRSEEARKKQKN